MAIRKYKPTSPGRRFMTVTDYSVITTDKPEKSLLTELKRTAGRNNQGRITVRHRGGGAKRKYRIIDFKRTKDGVPAKVASIEYDPNRSAFISLLHYADGEKRYIIAPLGLKVGDVIMSGEGADIMPGNCLPIQNIPLGSVIHCIEMVAGKGAQLCRGAGTSAQLMAKMCETVDVPGCVARGDFEAINGWLRERIWRHGSLFKPTDLMGKVFDSAFDAEYYIAYLEAKAADIYGV